MIIANKIEHEQKRTNLGNNFIFDTIFRRYFIEFIIM
jgi:hypothetical protein